jgi:hypothetical protein
MKRSPGCVVGQCGTKGSHNASIVQCRMNRGSRREGSRLLLHSEMAVCEETKEVDCRWEIVVLGGKGKLRSVSGVSRRDWPPCRANAVVVVQHKHDMECCRWLFGGNLRTSSDRRRYVPILPLPSLLAPPGDGPSIQKRIPDTSLPRSRAPRLAGCGSLSQPLAHWLVNPTTRNRPAPKK